VSGIKTTQRLYKFYNKAATTITKRLIEEGYNFDYNSFGVDGFTPSMGTLQKMDEFMKDLCIPNEVGDIEYFINREVIKKLREHRREKYNKDNE
jgi:hypothetical protein